MNADVLIAYFTDHWHITIAGKTLFHTVMVNFKLPVICVSHAYGL